MKEEWLVVGGVLQLANDNLVLWVIHLQPNEMMRKEKECVDIRKGVSQ